jgi:adenosine deaminase
MDINSLPKVELHLHLDCSLSYKVVSKIDTSITEAQYLKQFVGPPQCTDLADFLTYAQMSIALMQSAGNLRMIVFDLFEQLKEDHVIYAEIRFAPLEHTKGGLSALEVVKTVNEAVEEGINEFGIEARLILCTLRHYSADQSMKTVQLVKAFKGSKVVGFDIASDEAGHPVDAHIAAFQFARSNYIPCTAHAGEARGEESLRQTIALLKPDRIGHGVRCVEDEKLMEEIKNAKLHLEICPTSNIQTAIYNVMENHALDRIYRYGISCGVNTDNRTISNTSLNKEYCKIKDSFNWGIDEFKQCNLEAIAHAFIDETLKNKLKRIILESYHVL